ncbi:MAG: sigma-70 family RNA polymerase sigma factor [Chloroflexota bacterium]
MTAPAVVPGRVPPRLNRLQPGRGVRPPGADVTDPVLEAAYAQVRPGLLRWLISRTRDEAAAEDCCEEAFLRLVREARTGQMPDCPAPWLFQVAHNLLVSEARHARVVNRELASLPRGETSGPDPVAVSVLDHESVEELTRALAGLRAEDRSLVLQAADGATGPALAEQLGVTPMAVRTRLHRARRRLVDRLPEATEA